MRPKDILSRLFWDKRLQPEDYSITFIHRGAPGDSKTISCSSVTKAAKSWFLYAEGGTEVFIPYHRILEINNIKTNEILWKKISR
ncbi:MAG: RNA repair domain-containing protein [Candidatus Bathyarchaeia archaeon]